MDSVDFNKLLKDIQSFLDVKYHDVTIKELTKDNCQSYIEELEKKLQNNDSDITNFLCPHGKLKKMYFDLSDFDIDEATKEELNIENNNEVQDRVVIPSYCSQFLGFDLTDVVNAGFTGIIKNSITKEVSLKYNSLYEAPSKGLKDKLKELFEENDVIYCYLYDPQVVGPGELQKTLSKNKGDTSQDLIEWYEEVYRKNNGE